MRVRNIKGRNLLERWDDTKTENFLNGKQLKLYSIMTNKDENDNLNMNVSANISR